MQIRNSVVCDTDQSSHAFPLKGSVGLSANTILCGSGGIISTTRPELPYSSTSRPSLGSRNFSEWKVM